MGGSSKGSKPKQPDPARTAAAQYKYNRQSAFDSARLNQIGQETPFGRTYWTGDIGSPDRTQHTTLHPALSGILFGDGGRPGLIGQIGQSTAQPIDFSAFSPVSSLDFSGLPDARGGRQEITDAIYQRAANLRRPAQERERADIENTLWQRGLAMGSDAYDEEINRFEDARNREMSDLSLAAVLAGAQEQRAIRSQLAQELQARAGFEASQRQQQIAEAEMARRQPIDDLTILLSGTAPGGLPGMPQFAQSAIAAPDYMGLVGSNYAARAGANAAQQAGMFGALGQIGGAALPFLLSDRRLKMDIQPVGKLENGLTVYLYRKRGQKAFEIGLMADEVEKVHPDAVMRLQSGYDAVDYQRAAA